MGSHAPLPAPSGVALGRTSGRDVRERIIDNYGVDDVATSAPLPRIQVVIDEEDSDEDFREDEGGGKKRKGASTISDSSRMSHNSAGDADAVPKIRQGQLKIGNETIPIFPPAYPKDHSREYRIGLWQRNRFLRRKAALITLYLDAQAIILAGTAKIAPKPNFPDVPAFEKLLPALEYVNVGEWAPDTIGWRDAPDETVAAAQAARQPRRDAWRTNLAKRKRDREARKPVVRGGWAPEGSFEFECECKTSGASRSTLKDRAALQKLIVDLKAIVLSSPNPPPPLSDLLADETQPSKTRRRIDRVKNAASATSKPTTKSQTQASKEKASGQPTDTSEKSEAQTQPMSKTPSMATTDSKETNLQTPPTPSIAPSGAKKKPKKKKRSVLANQGNPHHVDNYRSNRVLTPQGDPYEPYPSHANMLFPPPMKFLAARPQRKTAPLPGQPAPAPIRPSEDEFTCCFCYYALYFGSEKLRKWAIRERRREIKRKDAIKQKAKNVAEGKGMNDDEEEDDYDDDEDDMSCEDDEDHDERCTCGRAINRRKARTKPPDRDDSPTPVESIPDVDSLD